MKEAQFDHSYLGDWKSYCVYGLDGQGVAMEPLMGFGDQS